MKLFYFTKPGDFVLDPMAGGGVVSDVCMLFERIECPLSSERLESGNQVQKMQDKRILGTVGRTLLIAKKT